MMIGNCSCCFWFCASITRDICGQDDKDSMFFPIIFISESIYLHMNYSLDSKRIKLLFLLPALKNVYIFMAPVKESMENIHFDHNDNTLNVL